MVKNILDISESGYRQPPDSSEGEDEFTLPAYLTLGLSKTAGKWTFSLDNEFIFGQYGGNGGNDAEFWLIRAGVEHRISKMLRLRGGTIVPVIARTSTLGNIRNDIPSPKIGASAGVGITFDHFVADMAVYGDPAKSYIEQDYYLKAAASVTIRF